MNDNLNKNYYIYIMGKKLTQDEFLNRLPIDRNYEVIEQYTKGENRIKTKDKYGICSVIAESLLAGYSPSIQSALDKNLYFINKAKEVHSDKYDYHLSEYIKDRIKVKIICSIHGFFEQTPLNHIHNKQGCPKCGAKNVNQSRMIPLIDFFKKANEVHNNKYDYSKSNYVNISTKILIICPIHGEFKQQPFGHINDKHGCPKCGNENNGWRRSLFAKRMKDFSIFYIINCYNDTENFYKIGITNSSTKLRYSGKSRMPYQYNIIKEIKSKNSIKIWDLEIDIKKSLTNYKYNPLLKFKGCVTECFSDISCLNLNNYE